MSAKIAYQPTSRAAWDSFRPISGKLDDQIIAALRALGGLTSEEMETLLKRKHQAVSGNLRHLVERGLVEASGQHRLVDSGRRAIVWRVTRAGRAEPEPVSNLSNPVQGELL